MVSLLDESTLGAKQRIEMARRLRENQNTGFDPRNWGFAIPNFVNPIVGALMENSAQSDLKDAERKKTAATIRAMNSMGIEAPPEIAEIAGTPAQEPSFLDKAGAFMTGNDSPQGTPAQPFQQNVVQGATPDNKSLMALMLANPEMAGNVLAMQKAQKENNPDPYFQPPVAATVGGKPTFIRQNARNGEITPIQINGQDVMPIGYDIPLNVQKTSAIKGAETGNSVVEIPNPAGGDSLKTLGKTAFPELNNDYRAMAEKLLPSLIQTESGGNPNAVSPKGAVGLTQIMPATAKNPGYGVQPLQNNSPEEAKRFTTDYLTALIKENGGDVNKALSAYNQGQGNLDKNGITNPKYVSDVLGGTIRSGQDAAQKTANEVEKQRLIEGLKAPTEKPMTEAQSNAYLFSDRMGKSNDILENEKYSPAKLNTATALESIPLVGTIAHSLLGNSEQKVSQAQRDFITAALRKESGASISQGEFDTARKQYFPQIGDTPDVIAQKSENRKTAIQGIKAGVPKEFLDKQPAAPSLPPMDAIQAEIARRKAARGQ